MCLVSPAPGGCCGGGGGGGGLVAPALVKVYDQLLCMMYSHG